jgi:hypothetical protein
LPCATVRRVIPGQISIVGFSVFIFRNYREGFAARIFWGAVAAATWSARTEAEGRLAETNLISSTDYAD